MFPDKKRTIYGEKKSVHVKDFNERDLLEAIEDTLAEPLAGLNLAAMRAEYKKAMADPDMHWGYVKVGIVGSDLVWRVKSVKGDKVSSVILYKNFTKKEEEIQQKSQEALAVHKANSIGGHDHAVAAAIMQWDGYYIKAVSREMAEKALAVGISPDGAWLARAENQKLVVSKRRGRAINHVIVDRHVQAGKSPAETGLDVNKAIKTAADVKNKVALYDGVDDIRRSPGYFDTLSDQAAEAKLEAAPDESWLVHGATYETGLAILTWKRGGKVLHARLDSLKEVQTAKRYMAGNAARQITA